MASFAEATAVQATGSHKYTADLRDDWAIGNVPHGGYVTSVILCVAHRHFTTTLARTNQPDCLNLHLEFLRRTSVGPASFTVKDLKLGAQTSTIAVSLVQDEGDGGGGREEVVGFVTHSNLSMLSGLSLDTQWKLDPPAPKIDLAVMRRPGETHPGWFKVPPIFPKFRKALLKFEMYLPSTVESQGLAASSSSSSSSPAFVQSDYSTPTAGSSCAVVDEWLRLADGSRMTNLHLGAVVDMFPLIVENYRAAHDAAAAASGAGEKWPMFWYPTLALNLEVKKKLPEQGVDFLSVRVRAKEIRNGRNDLEVVVMDEAGELVALSHHVAFVMSADRNLAARGKKEPVQGVSKI